MRAIEVIGYIYIQRLLNKKDCGVFWNKLLNKKDCELQKPNKKTEIVGELY